MALGTDPIRNHGFWVFFFHLGEWDKLINGKTLRISHQQWGFNQESMWVIDSQMILNVVNPMP